MEYPLIVAVILSLVTFLSVLILILMEYPLIGGVGVTWNATNVLILILMEYPLIA